MGTNQYLYSMQDDLKQNKTADKMDVKISQSA